MPKDHYPSVGESPKDHNPSVGDVKIVLQNVQLKIIKEMDHAQAKFKIPKIDSNDQEMDKRIW